MSQNHNEIVAQVKEYKAKNPEMNIPDVCVKLGYKSWQWAYSNKMLRAAKKGKGKTKRAYKVKATMTPKMHTVELPPDNALANTNKMFLIVGTQSDIINTMKQMGV